MIVRSHIGPDFVHAYQQIAFHSMGRNTEVDEVPMLRSDLSNASSLELSRSSSYVELNVKSGPEYGDFVDPYGGANFASVTPKRHGHNDVGKHKHVVKSGALGKCDNPFCTTCPSYFGDQSVPRGGQVPKKLIGGANNFRKQPASRGYSWLPGIFYPHTKTVQRWNKIFCISSLIAVFIDPLFFFLLSVRKDFCCLVFNNAAAVTVTVVRTLTDAVHLLHICLQFRLAYVLPASNVRGAGQLEVDPKKIAINYLKGWFFFDFFTALPLPQVLIWTVVKRYTGSANGANYAKNTLRVVVLLQNIPRALRSFPLLIGRSQAGFVFETAWANFVINLLMYLLAGHVVGACWYLFGLQRVNQCLQDTCRMEEPLCNLDYLDCGDNMHTNISDVFPDRLPWLNQTTAQNTCLSTSASFPYGIYTNGVQVTMERSVLSKYIYSLFWGFQQISTLAGNQIPSLFAWEVLFTLGITGLGLLLFALLIGNMQNFLQALGRRKLEMQLKRYDTEVWMKHRRLPTSLKKRVRQAGRHRWVATGGVEERELLDDLPEDVQKDVLRYLSLELVKKVRLFELLEDHVLDAICERLYQKLYIENSVLLTSKKPLERMLFIVRGRLESEGIDGSKVELKEGDFCGEELLSHFIDQAGLTTGGRKVPSTNKGSYPISSRTVKSITAVEAFSLEPDALEYITTHYKRAFRSPRVQGVIRNLSPYWRGLATSCIQKAWRARQARQAAKAEGSTRFVPAGGQSPSREFTRFASMNRSGRPAY